MGLFPDIVSDVLTGIIAGFKAQGFSSEHASTAGTYVHGMCGDMLAESMGAFGFLASDMVKIIPRTINQIIHKDLT